MRHLKDRRKLNRTSSHRRCLMANMLKSLIVNERIETTVPKAKCLRRYADRMITLAKKNSLASRRRAISQMMIRFNSLTPKQARAAKNGDTSSYNDDRLVIEKLFSELGPRFTSRQGGYTRVLKSDRRVGDNAQKCIIEFLES
ncbi:50S ribosomal protein L17 [Waddlia chondrophila]|uniref:Large ribosomal subunit protein bL17 n=1 Tax=Waddlia chondrophila (strain ATCC VR-1470 / WSU 86-1044) TaxID=716544 RepID=D6YRY4_WADCW|nr:50S ribosomal protein L17 [Waddlia chondrophila]ADI38829.1 50S ribosomal protein L17 [Waddlia chondrophila WSU 86-1044]